MTVGNPLTQPSRFRCSPHRTGVRPGLPPWFVKDCPECEAKKLAGKVTGNEGPPDGKKSNRISFGTYWSVKR